MPTAKLANAKATREAATNRAARLAALPQLFSSWYAVKQQTAMLGKKLEEGKKEIKEALEAFGEPDADGHRYLTLPSLVGRVRTLKYQRGTTKGFNDTEAEKILRGKKLWEDACDVVLVPNTDKINAMYFSKKLTKADINKMFPQNTTYSLVLLGEDGKQVS